MCFRDGNSGFRNFNMYVSKVPLYNKFDFLLLLNLKKNKISRILRTIFNKETF